MKTKIDRDKLNNADPVIVARAAISVIDALQLRYQPHEQVMGAVAMFLTIAERTGIPAQDLFTATKNLMNGQDGKRDAFKALDAYVNHEL